MSIQDHLKEARHDARRDTGALLDIAGLGQQALRAVGEAQIGRATELLGAMLAHFRAFEEMKARRAMSAEQAASGVGGAQEERHE